jgi:hypothetical protein
MGAQAGAGLRGFGTAVEGAPGCPGPRSTRSNNSRALLADNLDHAGSFQRAVVFHEVNGLARAAHHLAILDGKAATDAADDANVTSALSPSRAFRRLD